MSNDIYRMTAEVATLGAAEAVEILCGFKLPPELSAMEQAPGLQRVATALTNILAANMGQPLARDVADAMPVDTSMLASLTGIEKEQAIIGINRNTRFYALRELNLATNYELMAADADKLADTCQAGDNLFDNVRLVCGPVRDYGKVAAIVALHNLVDKKRPTLLRPADIIMQANERMACQPN